MPTTLTIVRKLRRSASFAVLALAALTFRGAALASNAPSDHTGLLRCRGVVLSQNGKMSARKTVAIFVLAERAPAYRVLWSEVRTLELDADGKFDVRLGTASPDGELLQFLDASADMIMIVEVEGSRPVTVSITNENLKLGNSSGQEPTLTIERNRQ